MRIVRGALAAAAWTSTAVAQDAPPPASPEPPPTRDADLDLGAPSIARFGQAGGEWLTLGTGAGWDFDENVDSNLHAAWSRFIADDVEFRVEAALWHAAQEGDDALGLNPTIGLRHHAIVEDDWTLFLDAGIGVVAYTDRVPFDGTAFNFTPRAGVGVTRALDASTRVEVGLRWHHISNARIEGEARNPARDAPFFYAGVSWAW